MNTKNNIIKNRPLISFCLFAYNQGKYIREAVEGAFNQTYSPLEIILSDDCSTDNTFEIMQEMAAKYEGEHKIILNRNVENLGFGAHINVVVEIAQGEWFAFAAGDDISTNNRIEIIYEELMQTEEPTKIKYIGTGVDSINHKGKFIESFGLNFENELVLSGCMAIYHSDCFKLFQPLDNEVVLEDYVLPFRALLIGKFLLIDKCTVKYRCDTSSDYFDSYVKYLGFQKKLLSAFNQRINDLYFVKKNIDEKLFIDVEILCQNWVKSFMSTTKFDIKNKEKKIIIYQVNFIKRFIMIFIDKETTLLDKIKKLLESFKSIRVTKYYLSMFVNKNAKFSFSEKKLQIDMKNIIDKDIIIKGYNNDFLFKF
jgi:glycosyltransferase involved in cell wall biosynthesis